MIAPEAGERRPWRARASTRARKNSPRPPLVKSQSLLDVVDTLIDKGLALDVEVVLGLANIDVDSRGDRETGTVLMRLESTVHELAERHGLDPADLNLDLGPLGTLR